MQKYLTVQRPAGQQSPHRPYKSPRIACRANTSTQTKSTPSGPRQPTQNGSIFGAGRETADEGVGSLTVVATTLGDGGEDQGGVERILETTENVLIVLDPELAARGIYPAIDFNASRISGEEQIRDANELAAARKLRHDLGSLTTELAAAEVRRLIEGFPDNRAALGSIRT